MEKIKLSKLRTGGEPLVIYWLYTENNSYKITGSVAQIRKWIDKNIDKALPYVYHVKYLTENSFFSYELLTNSICKNNQGKIINNPGESIGDIKTMIGVYHPSIRIKLLPYEKYINQIINGDSTLEYTVNCYNQKQKYALVQLYQNVDNIYKLIAEFKRIPRHYIKELDNFL